MSIVRYGRLLINSRCSQIYEVLRYSFISNRFCECLCVFNYECGQTCGQMASFERELSVSGL